VNEAIGLAAVVLLADGYMVLLDGLELTEGNRPNIVESSKRGTRSLQPWSRHAVRSN
jgi:hypothetical protein